MPAKKTHGMTGTTEYRIWRGIKVRCFCPGNPAYHYYGGRGITLHPEWINDFAAFYAYVGPRPSLQHTIDRTDNNKGYVPGNIRWALHIVQHNNKRNTRKIQNVPLQNIARAAGIAAETIARRIQRGIPESRAISERPDPTKLPKFIEFNGSTRAVKDWAADLGISANLICKRLRQGWPVAEALKPSTRSARQ